MGEMTDIEVTRGELVRIANIVGGNSAARKALKELRARSLKGEDVACYKVRGALVVGPRIAAHEDGREEG